jgi:hypothetical protein
MSATPLVPRMPSLLHRRANETASSPQRMVMFPLGSLVYCQANVKPLLLRLHAAARCTFYVAVCSSCGVYINANAKVILYKCTLFSSTLCKYILCVSRGALQSYMPSLWAKLKYMNVTIYCLKLNFIYYSLRPTNLSRDLSNLDVSRCLDTSKI